MAHMTKQGWEGQQSFLCCCHSTRTCQHALLTAVRPTGRPVPLPQPAPCAALLHAGHADSPSCSCLMLSISTACTVVQHSFTLLQHAARQQQRGAHANRVLHHLAQRCSATPPQAGLAPTPRYCSQVPCLSLHSHSPQSTAQHRSWSCQMMLWKAARHPARQQSRQAPCLTLRLIAHLLWV